MRIRYSIKEEKENFKESVIEKVGHTTHFTVADIEAKEKYVRQKLVEWEAQYNLDKAAMENVAHFNPFINDLTPEQLHAVSIYARCKENVDMLGPKIEEIKEALVESEKEQDEIYSQLGFVKTSLDEPQTTGEAGSAGEVRGD